MTPTCSRFNKLCIFIFNLCLCLVSLPFHKTYITHQRTFSPVQSPHQSSVIATQLCKFSYHSFYYIGQSRRVSNDSIGHSYQALRFALRLDVPVFAPMLVAPALRPTTMLEVPARQTPMHDINSATLWPPAFITSGPSYPHEPGPAAAATDQAATTTNLLSSQAAVTICSGFPVAPNLDPQIPMTLALQVLMLTDSEQAFSP